MGTVALSLTMAMGRIFSVVLVFGTVALSLTTAALVYRMAMGTVIVPEHGLAAGLQDGHVDSLDPGGGCVLVPTDPITLVYY